MSSRSVDDLRLREFGARTALRGLLVCLLAGGLLVLWGGGQAFAALWLVFAPSRAAVGVTVRAETLGKGALSGLPAGTQLSVYLAPEGAGDIRHPGDPRLIPIGQLRVDANRDGSLTFRVPALREDRYNSFVLCQRCARWSAGRSLIPAGPFTITHGSTAGSSRHGQRLATGRRAPGSGCPAGSPSGTASRGPRSSLARPVPSP